MSTATPQKFEFQAEIAQLLDIVTHSLYTEKEIFVRELVSNASDALEKLRHAQLTEKEIFGDQALEINVTTDDKARTLTIQDYGIGMPGPSHENPAQRPLAQGVKARRRRRQGRQPHRPVRRRVTRVHGGEVREGHALLAEPTGHLWERRPGTTDRGSEGPADQGRDRTEGRLRDFAQDWKVKDPQRYSASVVPDQLNGKRINTVQAPVRSKTRSRGEYTEFYIPATLRRARLRLHFSADAPSRSTPVRTDENTENSPLAARTRRPLYCRKVLIDAKPKDILPEWLRFMKGVVDSEDLPLNISRETTQDRSLLEKLNKVITKRFLKFLDEEAKNRPESYAEFSKEFGVFLKEGAALDYTHKDQLVKLLRFESSLTEKGKTTSLADYVTRMGADQKEIYYLIGPNRASVESGPYLEGFKARTLEVLFCYEAVDEYVMNSVREFDGKKLTAADHADVKLSELPKPEGALSETDTKTLTKWLKDTLGERVADVKSSDAWWIMCSR